MTIKTVETENEGLKRAFMLTIPAKDIEARVDKEVKRIAPQVRMPGFRPGKVPPNLIRKMHGDALQQDALNGAVQESVQQLLQEQKRPPGAAAAGRARRRLRSPARTPRSRFSLEALPDVPKPSDRRTQARAADGRGRRGRGRRAAQAACQPVRRAGPTRPRSMPAETGDLVVIDFAGKVDGERVRGRHGRGHVGRARLGPADPGLRGPADRRQGRRQARGQRHLPGRLSGREAQGQAGDVRGHRQGGQDRRREPRSTRISPSRSASNRPRQLRRVSSATSRARSSTA